MYDLIVIGGGPAGTAAAITAARRGARVLVLERGRFPRHKVCGEFVSAESLGLLAGLFRSPQALLTDAIRIASTRIFLDGRVLRTSITPAAASIARFDMDAALWKSATEFGVEARDQTVVQKVDGEGPFRITTSGGEFETRALINATGRWSNLNSSSASNGAKPQKWLGVKAHFAEISPACSVDLYFFDGGYCGVQPLASRAEEDPAGRINACAMVRADVASSLDEVFLKHPALAERSRGWKLLSEPVSTSPLIFRRPEPTEGSVLRCGDAAGFVDPFVGDGISLALRSGALAGECLSPFLQQETSLTSVVANYGDRYERELGGIFRNSSRIRQALLLPKAVRAPALFVLQNMPALTRRLVTMTR